MGCGEGGILGPVVGVMGVLQALEAIKLITRGDDAGSTPPPPTMLLFSSMDSTPFRSVRMRGKRGDCFACSEGAPLTLDTLESSMDYVQFCGVTPPVRVLQPDERISVEEYNRVAEQRQPHLLVDVREKEPFGLCNLEGSINVPISRFTSRQQQQVGNTIPDWLPSDLPPSAPIYVVCREGNDSQIAARKMKEMELGQGRFVGDIQGGLVAWKAAIDPSLPFT